ncbi:MAG: hypothetical protein V2A72_03090 [Candidatus Omnitrophota bacterium]
MPIQSARPQYKIMLDIKLDPPKYIQTNQERIKWIDQQIDSLTNEFGEKQLPLIKEQLFIFLGANNTLKVEITSFQQQNLKLAVNKIVSTYMDKANNREQAVQFKTYESRKSDLDLLSDKLAKAQSQAQACATALTDFQKQKIADNTPQITKELDNIKVKLSSMQAVYTVEHPMIKDILIQAGQKEAQLAAATAELAKQQQNENKLSEASKNTNKVATDLLNDYDALKKETIMPTLQDQNVAAIVNEPLVTSLADPKAKMADLSSKLLVGLLAAFLLGYVTEASDKTVWNESEIKKDLGIRTLGTIAAVKTGNIATRLLIDCDKNSEIVRSFESFRSNIQFINLAITLKTILYSSLLNKNVDFLAGNLAISMTMIGGRVGLLNISRAPLKYEKLLLPPSEENLQSTKGELDFADTKVKNLKILALTNTDIFDKQKAQELFAGIEDKFDVLIIDAPAVTDSVGTAALASISDGVILGAQAKQTQRDFISRNYKILNEINTRVLGVIVQ